MINLIKAELYKYSKRPYMYILSGALIFSIIFVMLSAKGVFNVEFINARGSSRVEIIELAGLGMTFVLYIMMVFGVVFTDEYRDGTLKNLLSSNVSRVKLYFSRFITQIILAYILCAVCIITFIIAINILEPGDGYSLTLVRDFVFRICVATLPYIGGIAIVNLLVVLLKKEGLVAIVYYFILMQIGTVLFLLENRVSSGFAVFDKFLLSRYLSELMGPFLPWEVIFKTALVSLIYISICTMISVTIFKKQDVK